MIDFLFNYENFKVINYTKDNNKINIYLKSKSKQCICPKCHQVCSIKHANHIRHIQDTPIHNTETWLHVNVREFECTNTNCDIKTISEELPFARKNKVKTDALIQFILSISMFMSSSCTSLILSFLGVKISADAVDDIIHSIKIVDNKDVEMVGIDDVAIRKGQTYATAIYDMNDHHLIALLDGRDAATLEDWLKNHKKIKCVARDRASAYAKAISAILPNCMQVADRFHLFYNLIDYLKEIFYAEMPEKIFIQNNEVLTSKEVKKVPKEIINIDEEILSNINYDNTKPVDKKGDTIEFDSKKRNKDSKQYKQQLEKRIKKQQKIRNIKSRLTEIKESEKKNLAKEFNISFPTLLKYEKMTDEEVNNLININEFKKKKTLMDNYINILYKMLSDGIAPEYIIAYIIKCGYSGSYTNLKDYVRTVAKNNGFDYVYMKPYLDYEYPNDVIKITRFELLKYILTVDEKKKDKNIKENIEIITEKYPIVKKIENIFFDFRETIFNKNPDDLDNFINKYKNEIPSFCNGLKKDITAVKNAISSSINSGFVEGNNNKFKLIKRIVYGKQKICNLFKKNYLCFLATTDDFDIEEIVNISLNKQITGKN